MEVSAGTIHNRVKAERFHFTRRVRAILDAPGRLKGVFAAFATAGRVLDILLGVEGVMLVLLARVFDEGDWVCKAELEPEEDGAL